MAAAADWTRARLTFEDPHHNPTFDTWTRLAAATRLLRDVQEELEVAGDMVAVCPAELSDPKYRDEVPVLRSRELLSDAIADTKPPAGQNPGADRRRAARASSPHAAIQRTARSTGATSEPPATAPPPRSLRTR
ncbi:hypothetical protein ABZ137_03550 [Streptomyces bobili]|uniref:hypothetical protein n=1 Tax=Streptomyces bobili TaxID=67280 RepID=UPI0033A17EC1